jgi:hypothetical protein
MRELLGSRQELEQVEVDRVYRQLRAGDATDAQLPKGQSPTTTLAVARALEASGTELSAAEVATATGVSRRPPSAICRPWPTPARWSLFRAMAFPAGRSTATAGSGDGATGLRKPGAAFCLGARSLHDPTVAQRLPQAKPEATMASFENTVTIRRPIAAVFAFLADFENIPAWNYAIVETRKVSPGAGGWGRPTARSVRCLGGARRASR